MLKPIVIGFFLCFSISTGVQSSEEFNEKKETGFPKVSQSLMSKESKTRETTKHLNLNELDQKISLLAQENSQQSSEIKMLRKESDKKNQDIKNLEKLMEKFALNQAVQAGQMPVYYRIIRAEVVLTTSLVIATISSLSTLASGGGIINSLITFMGTFYTAYFFLKTARDVGTYASNIPILKPKN
jgi:hypothetical protein